MRQFAICWVLGIVACQFLSELPSLSWSFLSLHCVLLILNKNNYLKIIGTAGLGFFYAFISAHYVLSHDLPIDLEGKLIEINGRVVDIPQNMGYGTRFEFEVDSTPTYPSFKARLIWNNKDTPKNIQINQQYKLQVRLKRSHGLRNPNTFDQERWFFQHRIRAQGNVKSGELLEPIFYSFFQTHLMFKEINDSLRFQIFLKLKEKIQDLPRAGILMAIILGEEKDISYHEWEVFRMTGTTHIVSVSGSHLAIIVLIIFFITKQLIKIVGGKWLLTIKSQHVSIISSFVIILIYAWLAGFSVPTLRSFSMFGLVFLFILSCKKNIAASYLLSFAFFLVSPIDPLSVLSIGFWLSFGGIAILMWTIEEHLILKEIINKLPSNHEHTKEKNSVKHIAFPSLKSIYEKIMNYMISLYKGSVAIFIALIPPLLFIFGQIPLLSIIANIIIISLFTFLIMPLLFLGVVFSVFGLENFLLFYGGFYLDKIMILLEFLSKLDIAIISPSNSSIWAIIFAMVGSLFILMPKGMVGKWVSLAWFLPMLFPYIDKPKQGEIYFDVLDVGQGLSVVIRTKNNVLIYDTAPAFEQKVIAESTLIPFLRGKGIQEINTLIISHPHADHAGGVKSLLQHFEIYNILTTEPKRWANASYCKNGQFWEWDGVTFEMLAGEENYYYNNSCVLKITTGKHSILLTGDIERDQELKLAYEKNIKANILVAPHHGSKTSSTHTFVNAVQPEYALFSVGYKNQFKHPRPEIIQRYQMVGVQTLETQNSGTISFQITPENISPPQRYREINRYYWHR